MKTKIPTTTSRMIQFNGNLRTIQTYKSRVEKSLDCGYLVSAKLQCAELDRALVMARQTVEMLQHAIAEENGGRS